MRLFDDRALIHFGRSDELHVDRASRVATLVTEDPPGVGELVHPCFTRAATAFATWQGSLAVHAGAVATPQGAWGVAGETRAGKSTLLAAMALAGHTVLVDDLLVVSADGEVFGGPRCVDLRTPAPEALGVADRVTPARATGKLRLGLGPSPAQLPLAGWVVLAWGDELRLDALRARERYDLALALRSWLAPPKDPQTLFALTALPVWRLTRPERWDAMQTSVERLAEAIGA